MLGKWLSKFTREYADLDLQRTLADRLRDSAVNLFGDDDFVPVFGKRFEQLSEEELAGPRRAIQVCSQQGDSRDDRMMYGVVLVRPFSPGRNRDDVAAMVEYRRTLRQLRPKLLAELQALAPSAASLERASAIRDTELPTYEVLWPSEYRELKAAVDATFPKAASPSLLAWVDSVVNGASGLEGLNAITAALGRFEAAPRASDRPNRTTACGGPRRWPRCRHTNSATIHAMIGQPTPSPSCCEAGPAFHPFTNTKAEAAFADFRTYVYQGREVGKTRPTLGFDLASFANTPGVASNRGKADFCGRTRHLRQLRDSRSRPRRCNHSIGHLSSVGVKLGDLVE